MRTLIRALLLLVVATALVGAGWWAGRVALEPPPDPLAPAEPITYTVTEGTVGRSLQFATVAEWPTEDLGRSGISGTVTSIGITPGAGVGAGAELFSVDLRPVTMALGDVPMFRDLVLRTEGPDVIQLQDLLQAQGFLLTEATGVFDGATREAVRAWQLAAGVPVDGVVRRGDLVFVPDIPARVVLTDAVEVGAPVSVGDIVVRRIVGDPVFVVPLTPEQRGLVPLRADVIVEYDGGVWNGRIAEAIEDETSGQLLLVLESAAGGALCGATCTAAVPLIGRSNYPVRIVVVPETVGPVVPVAAIETEPDGRALVRAPDGTPVPVSIVAASAGLAVVEGVDVGSVILLPVSGG